MEEGLMGFFTVKEKQEILTIIDHVISKGVAISVNIQGCDGQFSTRVVKLKRDGGLSSLIIEKLYPEPGNFFIQSYPDVTFSFDMSERKFVFATQCIGINTEYPDFGFIVSLPSTIQIEDRRRQERIENGLTKFLSVELTVEGDATVYHLKVINIGTSGIGLIVGKDNFDLLNKVNVGDTVRNLRFFLPQAVLTMDGTVKHKTQIPHGRLKGNYILGIESGFIMDLKELRESLKKKT